MKVEIINKPMLCWDSDESMAEEWHVLAKVTECNTSYPFRVVANEKKIEVGGGMRPQGKAAIFMNAKPIPEEIEMTVAEISKALGKRIKIIE